MDVLRQRYFNQKKKTVMFHHPKSQSTTLETYVALTLHVEDVAGIRHLLCQCSTPKHI